MKSRALCYCVALSFVLAIICGTTFKARSDSAPSTQPTAPAAKLQNPRITIEPVPQLAAVSLWNRALPFASLLSQTPGESRATRNPVLPDAEEFVLTPADPSVHNSKTILSVRFAPAAAQKLNSSIPMMLSKQYVVLQRSADDPGLFSTPIDFDWLAFASEQQARKDAAYQGRMVPMFEGRHFIGTERMQYLDPEDISNALQKQQPLHFSKHIFDSSPANIDPDQELMITDLAIVGDSAKTWDVCTGVGNANNPWTFKTLMTAIRNADGSNGGIPVNAEKMLDDLLATWNNDQSINGFSVPKRTKAPTLLSSWPVDGTGHHSLANAPVRLNAIVNRIDLGQAPNSPTQSGELRFVFGVTGAALGSDCHAGLPFNIILEYNVPESIDPGTWAGEWHALQGLNKTDETYQNALKAITDQVVTANKCPGCTNGSAIHQARSNEIALDGRGTPIWEQREFHLGQPANPNELVQTTIAQTPDGSFTGFSGGNFGKPLCAGQPPFDPPNPNGCSADESTVTDFINANLVQIDNGSYLVTGAIQGASAFNGFGANAYWNGNPNAPHHERVIFSENTCNGCHGIETATGFQQVINRQAGSGLPAALSNFLLGCTGGTCNGSNQCSLSTQNLACVELVTDPVLANSVAKNSFGDIARRVVVMQGLLPHNPNTQDLFLPFNRPHISFVH